jgi:uncharacterized membrane protein YeaQ/YmgE (transglycosylase-associated protein family)
MQIIIVWISGLIVGFISAKILEQQKKVTNSKKK